jgi:hypothetical protein
MHHSVYRACERSEEERRKQEKEEEMVAEEEGDEEESWCSRTLLGRTVPVSC